MNVGEIICEHVEAWLQHPIGVKRFLHLIERLYLKACSKLEKSPQVVCTRDVMFHTTNLSCIIVIHKNKVTTKKIKTRDE